MARDKDCCWHFAEQTGIDEGPNDALTQHFKKSPYSALIRESIQNSLDAVLDATQPVRVSIEMSKMSVVDFPSFFTLDTHIKGCMELYPNNSNAEAIYKPMLSFFGITSQSDKIDYIKVSDTNTKGMPYREGDTNCPFYAFALSRGVSAKENQSAGGSFGFGKAAYFNMSPIRTIMVSTQTPEGEYVFEGIASLCTHLHDGKKKTSVGYYDNNGGKPITNVDRIPVPFKQKEPGTSISIMGINPNAQENMIGQIIEAVLRNFWMAIWNEKLVVTISISEFGININKERLPKLMESYFPEEIDKTKWSNYYNPRPYFDAVRFEGTSSRYKEIPIGQIDHIGEVKLYVNLNREVTNDKMVFMRKPMMFVYSKRTHTNYGFNGVFMCKGERGNNILRKVENPAHDEWKAENWKDENNRTHPIGKDALDSISRYITETIERLFVTDDDESLNITGLEDYLYVPEDLISGIETATHINMQESLIGKPTGEYKEDGASVTTEIAPPEPTIKEGKEVQMGHVVVVSGGSTNPNPSSNRTVGIGHSHTGKGHKNTLPTAGRKNYTNSDVNDDGEGSYLEYIPVTFRVIAQKETGNMYHSIIFHSPAATKNGEIELEVGGEQSDEILDILESSSGKIKGNFITNLNVAEGRNIVKVRFADNMKHAVILKAYERK